jgi:hypothetical protein
MNNLTHVVSSSRNMFQFFVACSLELGWADRSRSGLWNEKKHCSTLVRFHGWAQVLQI